MNLPRLALPALALLWQLVSLAPAAPPDPSRQIPEPLKAWESWATWDAEHRACPTPPNDPKKHLCFWPSQLAVAVQRDAGQFTLGVTVFHETWIPLPGSADVWPLAVTANGQPAPVVEHAGKPSIRLGAGTHEIAGTFRWSEIPPRLALPREIGILALTVEGKPVESPAWDAEGSLWLKRDGTAEETEKNFLAVKVHALLEDGIPLWLRTEIELTVSGKSREEELGTILPEGWRLSAVESPIPVAIDESGRVKAQVRAGKWTLHAHAFRFDNPTEFRYAAGSKPAAAEQLVAFRAKPDFRMVEIVGAPSIDVSQTTFPEKWRELPVYRWDTAAPFRLEERMRGMGMQKPAGLTIRRELWLDENGRSLTFRDHLAGQGQQVWRLDAAEGQDLGSVRAGGQGQLITRNPQTAAPGVEIRTRNLDLDATGRMDRSQGFTATGWRSDADSLTTTLNLPPGWRLFALFGADWVQGDWLTAWSLLDLFLLLIFTLAVFRLSGWTAAALACAAFAISYHEPGAPRAIWLLLLIPLALQNRVPEGAARRVVGVMKWTFIAVLVVLLVPFVTRQVRQALYPQLEVVAGNQRGDIFGISDPRAEHPAAVPAEVDASVETNLPVPSAANAPSERTGGKSEIGLFGLSSATRGIKVNLQYDTKARIQTGPGVPEWNWREVGFGWNGPVLATQKVHPILIPAWLERVITVGRVALVLALAAVLLGARRLGSPLFRGRRKSVAATAALALIFASPARAEIPDQATLDQLRARLLEPSDAFPHAADIPSVALTLNDRRITIAAEVHTAIRCAVPLPGRLPAWSPITVLVDDKPGTAVRREDGFLWVVLEPGVHRVRVEGLLTNVTEWEWTFLLKPRAVTVDAPSWNVTGVRPDGVPEAQVFFARKQKSAAGEATYDRQDLQTIAVVDRHLEFGLVWQIRTTVTRLSPPGKAIALRIPLLPGENIFSSNVVAKEGAIEVRLGAQEQTFTWESGLTPAASLTLATRAEDTWVERWRLVASPVWNVALSGLAPTFDATNAELVPTWQPWPGEQVTLAVSRPEAIAGATVTVNKATHEIALGKRQRVSTLELSLRCSLGEDFLLDLPADAEVTSLTHNGKAIPVRMDGTRLVVPLRPGEQSVAVGWKINGVLGLFARAEPVRLPVEAANLSTVVTMPGDRWVLWTDGPRRGPAVLFWVILTCSLLAALVLGRLALSPLRTVEWMLLVIGLTQVPLFAGLAVIGWLFFLAWRGRDGWLHLGPGRYNLGQAALLALTAIALAILLFAVGEGLLGSPEMFVRGNGSTRSVLRWYQARSDGALPQPGSVSVSIWWYRFLMLAWALWLAASLIRWLRMGWQNFSRGGFFRSAPKQVATPPPLTPRPQE